MTITIKVDPMGDLLLQFPQVDGNDNQDATQTTTSTGCSQPLPGPFDPPPPPTETIHLQVNSTIMCLISPFFTRMLHGSFSEAADFRASGSPRPFPIELPGDNGVAVTLLAYIAHHRSESVPELPSPSDLVALAIVADKYLCTAAVTLNGTMWLHRAIEGGRFEDQTSLCQLLVFAYLIDLNVQFAQIGRMILLQHEQTRRSEIENGLDLPIPKPKDEYDSPVKHDLVGHLFHTKSRLRQAYQDALMAPVKAVTKQIEIGHRDPDERRPPLPQACKSANTSIGLYFSVLDYYGLCPSGSQFDSMSLSRVIRDANLMISQEAHQGQLVFRPCRDRACICACGESVRMIPRLKKELDELEKMTVCLDCLKRQEGDETACRVAHI